MLLHAILRVLNSRCPACFKVVGAGAIRHGMRFYCSVEHRDEHLKRGSLTKRAFDRADGGGKCC